MSIIPRIRSRLITTSEAAELLNVNRRTILNWIDQDAIPYVRLPAVGSRSEYRIPEIALLRSLAGNYDLVAELQELDAVTAEAGIDDEAVLDALDDSD